MSITNPHISEAAVAAMTLIGGKQEVVFDTKVIFVDKNEDYNCIITWNVKLDKKDLKKIKGLTNVSCPAV